MRYNVRIIPSALRALNKLDRNAKRRITAAIDALADDPRRSSLGPFCHSVPSCLRAYVPCDSATVVYTIDDRIVTIAIVAIGHRRDIYRQR